MLSLWYYDSKLDIYLFLVVSKVSQRVAIQKKITDIAWENKAQKKKKTNGKENLVLALLIRLKDILSLWFRTRITNNFKSVLNGSTSPLVFSYCCVL